MPGEGLSGRAALLLLALAGCAHAKTPEQALSEIDTSTYALPTDTGELWVLGAQKGHVVVMQFFATWCVPCLAEVNQLKALSGSHPEVVFASVAFDLDADRSLATFRQAAGVPYALLVADPATRDGSSSFGKIPELPTTVVIDKQGKVRSAFTGLVPDADLEKLIAAAGR